MARHRDALAGLRGVGGSAALVPRSPGQPGSRRAAHDGLRLRRPRRWEARLRSAHRLGRRRRELPSPYRFQPQGHPAPGEHLQRLDVRLGVGRVERPGRPAHRERHRAVRPSNCRWRNSSYIFHAGGADPAYSADVEPEAHAQLGKVACEWGSTRNIEANAWRSAEAYGP